MGHTVLTKFSPEFPDMVLDCVIRINIIISLPGNLEEFFFRHDLPNAIHKELQYIKLFRSQAKILSIQESLPQVQVDFQADVGDLNRSVFSGIGA